MFHILLLFSLALAAAVSGCDSQVHSDYLGEPLGVLSGEVSSVNEVALETDIVLLWEQGDSWHSDENHGVYNLALQPLGHPIASEFPARFSMRLFVPPTSEGLSHWRLAEKGSVSIGHIAAMNPNAQDVVGVVPDYVLVYVAEESQGPLAGAWFGASALRAGYHLMERFDEGHSACPDASACLVPAPLDMDTPIVLQMGAELVTSPWGR